MENTARKRKRSRWFFEWILFFLAIGSLAAWQCYSRPIYIYLQTVTVVGNQKITTEEIHQMAGVSSDQRVSRCGQIQDAAAVSLLQRAGYHSVCAL